MIPDQFGDGAAVPQGATHLVIMGVSGPGKSTVASVLAQELDWSMAEAVDLDPQADISKLNSGTRFRTRTAGLGSTQFVIGKRTVLTCSAGKRSYRELLYEAHGNVVLIYLDGREELLRARVSGRAGHFMPVALLPSQLAALEPLTAEELATGSLRLDIERTPTPLVQDIRMTLQL
jgi:gluconokinase